MGFSIESSTYDDVIELTKEKSTPEKIQDFSIPKDIKQKIEQEEQTKKSPPQMDQEVFFVPGSIEGNKLNPQEQPQKIPSQIEGMGDIPNDPKLLAEYHQNITKQLANAKSEGMTSMFSHMPLYIKKMFTELLMFWHGIKVPKYNTDGTPAQQNIEGEEQASYDDFINQANEKIHNTPPQTQESTKNTLMNAKNTPVNEVAEEKSQLTTLFPNLKQQLQQQSHQNQNETFGQYINRISPAQKKELLDNMQAS